MKLLLLLAITTTVVYCNVISPKVGLPHFDMTQLSDDFKHFKVPASCSTPVKQCLGCTHKLAKLCILKWYKKHAHHVHTCKAKEGVSELDKSWQEASLTWHKTLQDCVTDQDLPAEAEQSNDDAMVVFRKKRGMEHVDVGDCVDVMDMDPQTCWKTFKKTMKTCKTEAQGCADYQVCSGEGTAPSDPTKLKWFNYMVRIQADKKEKKTAYHKKMHECMHPGKDFHEHMAKLLGDD